MKLYRYLPLFFILINRTLGAESTFIPRPLLKLSSRLGHHVLLAEKATHTLYLYANKDGVPQLLESFNMVSGKIKGDKQQQGDYKTPEGVFTLMKFLPHTQLIKMYGKNTGSIYGSGAFTLNYPNTMDYKRQKTGGGIWLHSTNDPSRLDKGLDSRGCLVVANKDLKEISRYIELHNTPIIVTHKVKYYTKRVWEQTRNEVNDFILSWLKAWQTEDLQEYLRHYSKRFHNHNRGSYQQFAAHKRHVFALPGQPTIKISDILILQAKDYIRVSFVQDYMSNFIKDIGRKELYLIYNDRYQLKIIDELWFKNGISKEAFSPNQHFFTPENQGNFE